MKCAISDSCLTNLAFVIISLWTQKIKLFDPKFTKYTLADVFLQAMQVNHTERHSYQVRFSSD